MEFNGLREKLATLSRNASDISQTECEEINEQQPSKFEVASLYSAPQDAVNEDTDLSEAEWSTLKFVPFSKSPLWDLQTENNGGKSFSHTTAMVNSYCNLLAAYLLDALKNGLIDRSKTQYVLELNAGNGCFSILVLQGLLKLLSEYDLNDIHLCYVLTDPNKRNCDLMGEHPYLATHFKEGRARVVNFDVTKNLPISHVLGEIVNPLLVVANGVFNSTPQELLYVHYGEIYAGEVALHVDGKSTEVLDKRERERERERERDQLLDNLTPMQRMQLGMNSTQSSEELVEGIERNSALGSKPIQNILYRWKKSENLDQWIIQQPQELQEFLKLQLNKYVKLIPHNPIFLPVGALTSLSVLDNNVPKGILLLAADIGPINLPAIKHTGLPTKINGADFSMPSNLHCISEWLKQGGALSTMVQQEINGVAFIVAVLNPQQHSFGMTLQATQQYLVNQNPSDSLQLMQSLTGAINVLSEEQILCYLRVSHFDPRVLQLFLPRLLKQGVKISARLKWCEVLSQVWRNHVPSIVERNERGEDDICEEFAFNLGQLAIDISHWQLAKQCFASELKINKSSSPLWHNLALASFATADDTMAEKCINNAVDIIKKKTLQQAQESPEVTVANNQSLELQQSINAYQVYCDDHKYLDGYFASDSGSSLTLQPLVQHHAAEFYLQYRDADIAALVRGYDLNTPEDVAAAIMSWQADPQQVNFALIHSDLGLVGACRLVFNDEPEDSQCKDNDLFGELNEALSKKLNRMPKGEIKMGDSKIANFSFWVGCDYQGLGLGSMVVKLSIQQACAMAKRQLLDYLITSVWQHNQRSSNILTNEGFVSLDLIKGKGWECEEFYYFGVN
jgi:RimJ/RimL family protein N-acetyltransferase